MTRAELQGCPRGQCSDGMCDGLEFCGACCRCHGYCHAQAEAVHEATIRGRPKVSDSAVRPFHGGQCACDDCMSYDLTLPPDEPASAASGSTPASGATRNEGEMSASGATQSAHTRVGRQRRRQLREEEAVLAAMRRGIAYGYDLYRVTRLRPGRLYPALRRLEADGLIVGKWGDGPEPRRRFYKIAGGPTVTDTAAKIAALTETLTRPRFHTACGETHVPGPCADGVTRPEVRRGLKR